MCWGASTSRRTNLFAPVCAQLMYIASSAIVVEDCWSLQRGVRPHKDTSYNASTNHTLIYSEVTTNSMLVQVSTAAASASASAAAAPTGYWRRLRHAYVYVGQHMLAGAAPVGRPRIVRPADQQDIPDRRNLRCRPYGRHGQAREHKPIHRDNRLWLTARPILLIEPRATASLASNCPQHVHIVGTGEEH
jgi:hypothetical protein